MKRDQTSADQRQTDCQNFKNLSNRRARLFLLSTKAAGKGINLVAAIRAVFVDDWNPSRDVQSMYRVYQ